MEKSFIYKSVIAIFCSKPGFISGSFMRVGKRNFKLQEIEFATACNLTHWINFVMNNGKIFVCVCLLLNTMNNFKCV